MPHSTKKRLVVPTRRKISPRMPSSPFCEKIFFSNLRRFIGSVMSFCCSSAANASMRGCMASLYPLFVRHPRPAPLLLEEPFVALEEREVLGIAELLERRMSEMMHERVLRVHDAKTDVP